MLTFLGSE